ncbi:MAG: hypothetical protein KDC38_20185 [Planctomycetes bacterium]|nr:hypothetical protein [Planctomycetota bacterium]
MARRLSIRPWAAIIAMALAVPIFIHSSTNAQRQLSDDAVRLGQSIWQATQRAGADWLDRATGWAIAEPRAEEELDAIDARSAMQLDLLDRLEERSLEVSTEAATEPPLLAFAPKLDVRSEVPRPGSTQKPRLATRLEEVEREPEPEDVQASDEPRDLADRREEYEQIYRSETMAPRLRLQNSYVDVTAGALNEPKSEATGFGSLGFNVGLPVSNDSLGLQVGGDFTVVEGGEVLWDATAGLFGRHLELTDDLVAGGAVLVDYRHSAIDADLFGLRWVAGISTQSRHHFGARGSYPLRADDVRINDGRVIEERMTLRHEGFWGHDWTDRLNTELWIGYQAGEADSMVFGAHASWALTPEIALAPMGEINAHGDYAVGAALVFDLGASARSSTQTRFDRRGVDDLTPFRKRSFPIMLVDHRSKTGASPATSGEPTGQPGDPIPPHEDDIPCDCFPGDQHGLDPLRRK